MTEQPALRPNPNADPSPPKEDLWRKEVRSQVASYRHRRARRIEGAFSMRFPFPPTGLGEPASELQEKAGDAGGVIPEIRDGSVGSSISTAPEARMETPPELSELADIAGDEPDFTAPVEEEAAYGVFSGPPETAAAATPHPTPRPPARRKVIAFPRQVSLAPQMYHPLADPIVPEQPRILDVPEELEAFPGTPLLDGLQLRASTQQAAVPADHIELPFQAVNILRRVYAGLLDCVLVAVAAAVFGAVSCKMLPKLAVTKPLLITAGAAVGILWAAYQYIFTMYRGATPGMRAWGIRLRTFKGERVKWRQRRSRVIALYFSTASLMMGLLWALVDVDALCWHDRISRTYMTNRE